MRTIFLLLILLLPAALFPFDYKVEIDGVSEKELLNSLKETSQTEQLKKKKPISTYQALRKRAEADLKKIVEICHYYGYLGAEVDFTIRRSATPTVVFKIDLGPMYTIKEVLVIHDDITDSSLHPTDAQTSEIIKAEEETISALRKKGYAFCKLIKKEILAHTSDHTVIVKLYMDLGPEVRFGKTTFDGNKTIRGHSITKHLLWKEGELYSPEKIEMTQQSLEKSALFSSVLINEGSESAKEGNLPMHVSLHEAKHKSFGSGVSYTTSKGPGLRAKWENRNIRGHGDKLTFHTELWRLFQNARLSLRQPHFQRYDQDRIWLLEFDHQEPIGYMSEALSGALLFERHLNKQTDLFWGGKLESLRSKSSEGKATYYLAKVPLSMRWSNSQNPMDPLYGQVVHTRLTPAYQTLAPNFGYITHTTTLISYYSFFHDKITLAAKGSFGNIFGAAEHTIPTPDRFFSGTENTLRGYRYLSVSPLNHEGKPMGGRSLLAGTLETRIRTDAGYGFVLFYDVGRVYKANLPILRKKLLESVGFGLRYATPIGPLRLDIAIPLNPRRKIDPHFQIYFSIGQSF